MLLNYPCNPTGHSFSASQLEAIANVARDNNIRILSDEIYGLISFSDQEHHSIAEFYPEGTLVTGGVSKDRSLGGFRLGVMIVPKDANRLTSAILALGSEIWSCVSAPIQYAGLAAYDPNEQVINYIRDCTAIHEIITKYVHHRLETADIRCPAPQGAFYLFPDWNQYQAVLNEKGIVTSNDLSKLLLKNWNVATLPGTEFGMPENDLSVRLATVDYDGAFCLKQFTENRKAVLNNPKAFIAKVAPRVVQASDQLVAFTNNVKS